MLPPLTSIPPELVALADYEAAARARMSEAAWAYLAGGSADEITLRENSAAFARLRLRGRVLAEFPGGGHTRVELFGRMLAHPVLLAPVAYQRLAHPEGERAAALGAAASGALYVASTQASVTLEEIAAAAPGASRWFQLYMQPDRDETAELVARAERAGYEALVVTVDAPVSGVRNTEQRAGFRLPPGVVAANLGGGRARPAGQAQGLCGGLLATAPTWADLEWLCARTKLPVLVKGVTDPRDAERAIGSGAAGLVVSNHGGRTLDTLPPSVELLPAVVAAAAGRVPVLIAGESMVWDSLAICEYLAEQFPEKNLWPQDVEARAIARSICAEMHSGFTGLRSAMWMNIRANFPGKGRTMEAQADIGRISEIWETCFARSGPHQFLFGDFSIADAYFAPVVMRFRTYTVSLAPALEAYVERVAAHPAVAEWISDAMAEEATLPKYDVYPD